MEVVKPSWEYSMCVAAIVQRPKSFDKYLQVFRNRTATKPKSTAVVERPAIVFSKLASHVS